MLRTDEAAPAWPTVAFDGIGEMSVAEAAAILRKSPLHRDDWTRTVPSKIDGCMCVKRHDPVVLEFHGHHLWPKFLGGPEHPDTLLTLCPNTHTGAHKILRRFLKAGEISPRQPDEPRYAYHVASLGFQAWEAAGRPEVKELPHDR